MKIDLSSKALENGIGALRSFLSKIIGPAADEFGQSLADNVRFWRTKRQMQLLREVQQYAEEHEINIRSVDLKTLLPLLEHSSLENEPVLQEMWKALLINSADSNHEPIPSAYTFLLSQLSSAEAVALERLSRSDLKGHTWDRITVRLGLSEAQVYNLIRLGLVTEDVKYNATRAYEDREGFKVDYDGSDYRISPLGESLLAACQA